MLSGNTLSVVGNGKNGFITFQMGHKHLKIYNSDKCANVFETRFFNLHEICIAYEGGRGLSTPHPTPPLPQRL
jgi:hypothetical protein